MTHFLDGSTPHRLRQGTGVLTAAVLAAIYCAPANAQLEEVVVSARRVEESLQDVPISIVAFTGEELELRGIERGEDLMVAAPNVVITGSGLTQGASDITIRGMPNVGIYLDGVAQSSTGLLQQSLIELERMEILRGPQGTLFGRNSNGGAIQLISKRPAAEFGARVKFDVGEYSRQDISASVDVPLSDTVLSKFTAGSYSQDGQICSLVIPVCHGGSDDEVFRADFVWTPNDAFDLRVAYDYQRTVSSDRKAVTFVNPNHVRIAALNIAAAGLAAGDFSTETANKIAPFLPITEYTPRTHEPGFPGGEVGLWESKSDSPADGISTDFDQLTLTFNLDFNDNISLEGITAYWEKDQHQYRDIRGAEVIEAVEDDQYSRDRVFSQEFHLPDRLGWRSSDMACGPVLPGLRSLGYQLPLARALGAPGRRARSRLSCGHDRRGSGLRQKPGQLGRGSHGLFVGAWACRADDRHAAEWTGL